DYAHYAQFAPYVLESRIVSRQGEKLDHPNDGRASAKVPSLLFIWSKMRYEVEVLRGVKKSIISSHYIRVEPFFDLIAAGDYGIRWVLEPKHPEWKFPNESYFSILDGSWYILPLGGERTYVRYFLRVRADTWIPDRVMRSIFQKELVT